ncbi:major facilitator superfamily domain-containing protein [Biscogniauxia marginata]|nr:major facilitator superfamily domain-containing protein [Biscogniauxia marginata]
MTLAPQNADDSCLVNQTVPAAGSTTSPSEQPNEKNETHSDIQRINHEILQVNHPEGNHPAEDSSVSSAERAIGPDDGDEEADFPEGGLGAWLVVLGSFCAMFSVYGIINSAAVFESYFSTHQLEGYDSSTIGWIFSTYLFIVFFAGIQVGPLFDSYGPRVLVAVGSLLVVASQLLLGLCEEYYQIFLTYSVLGGLGGALLNVPAYGAVAHFFLVRRGLATGIATTAGSIGGIVFPLFLQAMLPRLGFAWSTRIIGFILLFLSAIANLLVRARLPPTAHRASVMPDWSLFRDLKFSLCCAGVFVMEWGIFIPLTYIVSYAAAHGQDASDAYTLLAVLNAGSFFGRCLPGFLADRMGRFNVIVVTNALCAISLLAFWLPARDNRALLIVFAVTFGFASGSNLGLYPVCIGQLCGTRDYGRFYSTALMLGSLGTLTSVPIGGALIGLGSDPEQGWVALILFSALSYVIAMSCFLGARVMAVSWRVKEVF